MDSGSPIAGFVFLVVGFVIYFLPAFIASNRKHVNGTSIFLVNLLLGWTFLGWVVALAWASSANTEKSAEKIGAGPSVSSDRTCPYCAETIKSAAIKCKHCGADVATDTASPGHSLPEALAASAVTVDPGDPEPPKASSIEFKYLCFALICVIISAAVYHLTKTSPAVNNQPQQQAYTPKADDQIFLDLAAFGCMSAGDFDRAIDHYNRGEYSAWADITVSKYCFFQKDVSPDISWTVMQVRDGAMQIGLKRAVEYSKNPDLGRFNYWTLAKWAIFSRPPGLPGEPVAPPPKSVALTVGSKSKPATFAAPIRASADPSIAIKRGVKIGTVVQIYKLDAGMARISKDGQPPEWIVPEMLDW